jgi:hypothetical protein
MGPPPIPPHQPFALSSVQNAKDQREFSEKYYKLKRKYWDLEEVGLSSFLKKKKSLPLFTPLHQ